MLDTVNKCEGKVLIYSRCVHNLSGVLTIKELFKANNYAEFDLTTGAIKDVTN
jgi:hypothetical protein